MPKYHFKLRHEGEEHNADFCQQMWNMRCKGIGTDKTLLIGIERDDGQFTCHQELSCHSWIMAAVSPRLWRYFAPSTKGSKSWPGLIASHDPDAGERFLELIYKGSLTVYDYDTGRQIEEWLDGSRMGHTKTVDYLTAEEDYSQELAHRSSSEESILEVEAIKEEPVEYHQERNEHDESDAQSRIVDGTEGEGAEESTWNKKSTSTNPTRNETLSRAVYDMGASRWRCNAMGCAMSSQYLATIEKHFDSKHSPEDAIKSQRPSNEAGLDGEYWSTRDDENAEIANGLGQCRRRSARMSCSNRSKRSRN